jgi:diguanylate cyclase (GGDEF)-like protein
VWRRPRARIWAVVVAVDLVAAALWAGPIAGGHHGSSTVPWWVLALAVTLCEAAPVHLEVRGEAHSVTLTEIPLVVGLHLGSPVGVVLSQVVGANVARLAFRRQSAIKHHFNAAVTALDATLAVTLFGLLSPHGFGLSAWGATLVATLVTTVVSAALVALVIALASPGEKVSLRTTVPPAVLVTLANASLALGMVAVLRTQASSIVLLLSPGIALVVAYRAYASERRERRRVDFLFRSTSSFLASRDAQLGLQELLREARTGFASMRAEVVLFRSDAAPLRVEIDAQDDAAVLEGAAGEMAMLERYATEHPDAVLVDRVDDGVPGADYLRARGYRDAMVGTLPGDTGPLGVVVVGDRRGEVDRFTPDDLRLFTAFVQQAAVVLRSDQLRSMLTELQSLQAELAYRADHDELTGLANRRLFADEVEAAVAACSHADGERIAVMFLDLDDFKRVNDSAGHVDGDLMLREVARRIGEAVRSVDTPARLGGDEFAVLLRGLDSREHAYDIATRVLTTLRPAFALNGAMYTLRASIGVAMAERTTRDAVELLRDADVAMYQAKAGGKGRAVLFEPAMRAATLSRHAMLADLEHAVEHGELDVAFQPIVALDTGRIRLLEALARWRHPRLGWVPPAKFVPLAESAGIVGGIGHFVLDRSCEYLQAWRAEGCAHDVAISINVSARELDDGALVDAVLDTIEKWRLEPSDIVLEITESVEVHDHSDVVPQLARLRAAGIRLAMDDFGTGYASLSLLRELPVEILKIDRSFVTGIDGPSGEQAFTRAITELGRALGLLIVAEGIETADELLATRALGCDLGQGYFFSRPVRGEAVPALVREDAVTSIGMRSTANVRMLRSA